METHHSKLATFQRADDIEILVRESQAFNLFGPSCTMNLYQTLHTTMWSSLIHSSTHLRTCLPNDALSMQ
jgi:hypothetical protein